MDKKLKHVFNYCGTSNYSGALRLFLIICAVFCITVYTLTFLTLSRGRDIFMIAPGIMVLVNIGMLDLSYDSNVSIADSASKNQNAFHIISLLSVLPMTRRSYDKWQFRHMITDNILYLYLLLSINTIYMIRGCITDISGGLGFMSLVAVICMILVNLNRFNPNSKKMFIWSGIIRVTVILLVLLYMLISQTPLFDKVDKILIPVFGIFAGAFSIAAPIFIFVFSIILFTLIRLNKKGSWRCG